MLDSEVEEDEYQQEEVEMLKQDKYQQEEAEILKQDVEEVGQVQDVSSDDTSFHTNIASSPSLELTDDVKSSHGETNT